MKSSILLVDDNRANLKLVADLLNLEGYCVLQAEDAESALKIVGVYLPDLILLDLGLPQMNGRTLLRLLRDNEQTKNVRVAALTAHAMKGSAEKAPAEGFDGYIIKPIDTQKFFGQVDAILSIPVARPTRWGKTNYPSSSIE